MGVYLQPDNYSDQSRDQEVQANNQVEQEESDGADQRDVEGERRESGVDVL